MTPRDHEVFATFELEPLDLQGQRSWQLEQIWQTARRKANRIALGEPRWRVSVDPDVDTLLAQADIRDYSPDTYAYWGLAVDLTLLPDDGCRFRSAELSVAFDGSAAAGATPLVRRLRPDEVAEHEAVVSERSMTLKMSHEVPAVVGAEAGGTRTHREEVTRTLVRIGSFGSGTRAAGWRFRLTNAREIPLATTDLEALVIAPRHFRGDVVYSVVAEIEIRSPLDRWLTAAFAPQPDPKLACTQAFPPRDTAATSGT
jgi:hypothetical protein